MKKGALVAFGMLIILQATFAFGARETRSGLTLDWIFDGNAQAKLGIPYYIWLNGECALLLDARLPEQERTLELFDPKTGLRRPALDQAKVLEQFKALLGERAPSSLSWPAAVDLNGAAFVYLTDGDLFSVETADSSVKRLTRTPDAETGVALSPDGKWVGFIRRNDLYAVERLTGREVRLTEGATETLLNGPFSWVYWEELYSHASVPYQWSPDSTAIAYLQTDDSAVPLSAYVNYGPLTPEVVYQRYPKAGQANPKVRLGVVEIASSKTVWMDCGEYEYLARFNWLRNGREVAVQTLNRRQSDLRLLFADRTTGGSREILTEHQATWINLNYSLHFLEDGKRFIWSSERDGYQHLYLYETGGRLLTQLTRGEFMVVSGVLVTRNNGLAGVDERSGWVYFTSNKAALQGRHLFRVGLDGTKMEQLTRGEGIRTARFSPGMKYFFEQSSSSSEPPALYLCRADGRRIATVAESAKSALEGLDPPRPEFLTFKGEGGIELPAMITKPPQFDPEKKHPVIVSVYGGPAAQNVVDDWSQDQLWNAFLAQQGYVVCVLEVRAGMSSGKALETPVYGKAYGMGNVRDILAGVEWLKSLPYVDPERLGLWGWSGGGCTTLYTMTHSDVFKAAIAVAPVSDWRFYDSIYTERFQGTPKENPSGYEETSSVKAASNLKGRLLVVHGTYDDNVHPQNTYAFVDKLIESRIPFDLMIYPWRKHGISDPPATLDLYGRMLRFWDQNLK
jgi:dipeptidyl-peptidase-4